MHNKPPLRATLATQPPTSPAPKSVPKVALLFYLTTLLFLALCPLPSLAQSLESKTGATASQSGPTPTVPDSGLRALYESNLLSKTFGAQLFSGSFANKGAAQFNPDYSLNIGDQVQIRLWGAFDYNAVLTIDPKGNIFIPNIGPVPLLGVKNGELQSRIDQYLRHSFRNNVYAYASLAAAQPVRVYVSGFVHRPGLYHGTSMDSVLHYLDQAGGIDPERGSFLDVQIKRAGIIRSRVNLYDFLLRGNLPLSQLADGDLIFVGPRQQTTTVSGQVENSNRFEFTGESISLANLMKMSRPRHNVTHVRVTRNAGAVRNTEYYSLQEAQNTLIYNGDDVVFTADQKPGTITVRVEGEHLSAQEYVMPYGSNLADILKHIQLNPQADTQGIQLFRQSAKERQKALLQASIKSLQATAMTARSASGGDAKLRETDAALISKYIEQAQKIEPRGQVAIAQSALDPEKAKTLLLENGDVIRIPAKDGLVLVAGEVVFPNTIAHQSNYTVEDYVQQAGGYTQNADNSRYIIAHRDGTFSDSEQRSVTIRPGDEILVMPKIDTKSRQFWLDLTQILYNIGVAARAIVGL